MAKNKVIKEKMSPTKMKTVALTEWVGIDRILFFNKDVKEYLGPKYEEYLGIKHSLLSQIFEMYNELGINHNDKELVLENATLNNAKDITTKLETYLYTSLEKCSNLTTKLLKEDTQIQKEMLENIDMCIKNGIDSTVAKTGTMLEKIMCLNLDNFLIAIPMMKCKPLTESLSINERKVEELTEAYKILRDHLISYAIG